jgi:hypothetical protein
MKARVGTFPNDLKLDGIELDNFLFKMGERFI